MHEIKGIECVKDNKYCIFHINELSNELKEAIRIQMSSICHGAAYADTGRRMYDYKNTVKEFLRRYEEKTTKIKKGMIGELLIHLLVSYYFDELDVVSPFFNMEERSIKKGYDVVLTESDKANLWLIEVKSGELHKGKNSNQTMSELLSTSKNDLKERLNEENNSLWQILMLVLYHLDMIIICLKVIMRLIMKSALSYKKQYLNVEKF